MFKLIPGNNKYKISLDGKIVRQDGLACTLSIIDNKVIITLYRKRVTVDVKWLGLMAHYEVNLPRNHGSSFWDINFVDTNPVVTNSITGKVMVFKKPMTVCVKYRVIPGFTDYAVTKEGVIKDLKDDSLLNILPYIGDYPRVYLYNPEKSQHMECKVHRLVALAWVYNDDYLLNCIVNHKSGDKQDYTKNNLEWETYSNNNKHAFDTGLRTDNKPCKVKKVKDGSVLLFASVRDACRYMGKGYNRINNLLHKKPGMLINGEYELKLLHDQSPWFYNGQKEIDCLGRYSITIIYANKSKETYYGIESIRKKFERLNLPRQSIFNIIEDIKNKIPGSKVTFEDYYMSGPYQAKKLDTDLVFTSDSLVGLEKLTGVNKSSIRVALEAGSGRVSFGFTFRIKSNLPWDTKYNYHKSSSKCILATNQITKEIKRFKSLRETSRFFKIDRGVIKNRLKLNSSYGDWIFKDNIS